MIFAWSLALLATNLVALGLLFWRGRGVERIASPIFLVAIFIEPILHPLQIGTWRVGSLLANLGLFLALWKLSERADRWWLVVAAAIQLVILITNLMPLMTGDFTTHTGVAIRSGLWVGISFTLFAGAWEARAAKRFEREGPHVPRKPSSSVP